MYKKSHRFESKNMPFSDTGKISFCEKLKICVAYGRIIRLQNSLKFKERNSILY